MLRPDMTPPVCKPRQKYFTGRWQRRSGCVMREMFSSTITAIRGMKESTQLGCEYIGVNSVDADSEIIAIVVDALRTGRDFPIFRSA